MAVNFILRFEEMHVAGRNDELSEPPAQREDAAVEFAQVLLVARFAVVDEKVVVAQRLNFKIIVERCEPVKLGIAPVAHDGVENFTRLARRADKNALAVLHQKALRDDGAFLEVLQMRFGDELVEIFQSHLVLHEQRDVTRAAGVVFAQLRHERSGIRERFRALVREPRAERCEDAGAHGGIVARAVVVKVRQPQRVGDDVELEFFELLQKRLRDGERIDVYGVKRKTAALCRGGDEADIKGGVVRHEREIANKVQKRAHGLRLARRAVHVAVGDAGELHDLRRNGHAGINERLKALRHDAIFHAHRADLGDAVNVAVQAGRFDIKADKIGIEREIALPVDGEKVVHIVDIVPLHAVNDLDAALGPRVPELRERLRDAVVRHGDGAVAPAGRRFHRGGRIGERVERGVARVEMELHALVPFGGVLPLRGGFLGDGGDIDRHVVIVAVEDHVAAHREIVADADLIEDRLIVALADVLGNVDAAGIVRHIEAQYRSVRFLYFPAVRGKDLARHAHRAGLQRKLGDIRSVVVLRQLAEEDVAALRFFRRGLCFLFRRRSLFLRRGRRGRIAGDLHPREPVFRRNAPFEHGDIGGRAGRGKAGGNVHRPLLARNDNVFYLCQLQPAALIPQGGAAAEHIQKFDFLCHELLVLSFN